MLHYTLILEICIAPYLKQTNEAERAVIRCISAVLRHFLHKYIASQPLVDEI